ncbi:hypothetical protein EGW08_019848 [Elysia chlorotica]|uniref:RNase H type-1 domain-containing protein n=1 Tax=Elysia chlorotica TaxID=188477 RepID=A0A433SSY9_ELYCH|nr:hypothetical protein EGW08_019848 [Elysia chlorotica]
MALKRKCQKALNILRVVGHTDWGADRETLLKLYRTLVRSKLDYGSIVYGSAKKHILKTLDPIHHQGLRIALGAFRTSPIQSLYAESGEPSLEHRRLKLSLNYAAKLNSIPENPGFESLTDSSPIEFFETKKSGPSLGARLQNHLEKIETKYENIDNVKVRKPPPWEQYNVKFDTSLTEFEKGNTNALVLQKEFLNLKEQYNEHYEIYTDGSKQDHKVAAAFFLPDDPGDSVSARLRDYSSVYSAELEAILMAMKMTLACLTPLAFQIKNTERNVLFRARRVSIAIARENFITREMYLASLGTDRSLMELNPVNMVNWEEFHSHTDQLSQRLVVLDEQERYHAKAGLRFEAFPVFFLLIQTSVFLATLNNTLQ